MSLVSISGSDPDFDPDLLFWFPHDNLRMPGPIEFKFGMHIDLGPCWKPIDFAFRPLDLIQIMIQNPNFACLIIDSWLPVHVF